MGSPTTTPLYESWHNGGFIVSQANGHRSIDKAVLTGAAKVLSGAVLGKQADGRYVPINFAAADGTQNAAGILYSTTDATAADKSIAVVLRSAEVNASELVWPAGATAGQIATATAQLVALGVVPR